MRLLLSFILTSLFFIAPNNSDASTAFDKGSVVTFANQFSQAEPAGFSDYGHQTARIVHKSNIRSFSNQHRLLPGIHPDCSGQFLVPVANLLPSSRLIAPYSYCKPIGLMLLFPKHYFW